MTLPDATYVRLLALRTELRRFERWSEDQARSAGLTPAQHQLLLAIRGHADPRGPTIGEVADYLLLRHHSTVGLVDRADTAGLVRRSRDDDDHRVVRLHLTKDGAARLEALSTLHLEEIQRLPFEILDASKGHTPTQHTHGSSASPRRADEGVRKPLRVEIDRVYDHGEKRTGRRILVDRLWPRGVSKQDAHIDQWMKDIAPSPPLRKWYGHAPARFKEFARRYREELTLSPARDALDELQAKAKSGKIILVTATKDIEHSAATVLLSVLTGS